jgi:hypothetical protein
MTDCKAFEDWHKVNYRGYVYEKSTNGSYLHVRLDLDYDIWQAATLAERERCAKIAEGGCFLHDDAPDARFGKACAKAIRGE